MATYNYPSSKLVALKLLAFASALSSCGMATHAGDGIVLSGSPEGVRAFSDMLAGTAQNAKASPDAPTTPYYELRKEQVRAGVMRFTQPRREAK